MMPTLLEELEREANATFVKLEFWVAENSHAILHAMLQELANNASAVTMARQLERGDNDEF